jgi:TorA maturation chaperone TorD
MSTMQKVDEKLLKADIYRLLANCFDFPTRERIATIKKISGFICEANFADEEIHNIICTLHHAVDEKEIINDYNHIFLKGGVPLSESHILKKFNSVSDVNAFYAAFGFSPKSGENPDAIMYELEFLALLNFKISLAPNEEAAEVTREAYRDFIKDHAGEFAIALAQRIMEGDAGVYFITLSHLLSAFIQRELSFK